MGTGKTYWSRRLGRHNKTTVISSDRIRKHMAGISAETRVYVPFGQGLYSAEMSRRVYETIHAEAVRIAGAGLDVILDASYMKHEERRHVVEIGRKVDAIVVFIEVKADENQVCRRLEQRESRGRAISDGRMELYGAQSEAFEPVVDLSPAHVMTLNNTGIDEHYLDRLVAALNDLRSGSALGKTSL
jgi:uncharacterized protein